MNAVILPLVETLREICSGLPGAEEYTMVHHPAFRVGKKPFVIAGLGGAGKEPIVSVNLGPLEQSELLQDARFARTPYLGRHRWVSIHLSVLEHLEMQEFIAASWRRVAGKRALAQLEGGLSTDGKAASAVKRSRK